ncbi:MAG: inositol monophosphatase family protein [Alphaproteobacteria bacterium]
MNIDMAQVASLLREAAQVEILPRFNRLKKSEIFEKTGPNDLVTAADLASEAMLSERLLEIAPGSVVVGEEGAAKNPGIMDRLAGNEYVWIIDPVDGTLNFTRGNREFTVIVALVHKGIVRAGWIHHVLDDYTLSAEEASGAWDSEGARLQVAAAAPLGEMTGALYVGARRTPELYQRLKALKPRLGRRSHMSCAGSEYLALARGATHYAIFTRLMPWDHAAGYLIHAEAGGYAAMLDESPYRPVPIEGNLLIAPEEETWRELRALLLATD